MSTDSIKQVWHRIRLWYEHNVPEEWLPDLPEFLDWAPPASDAEIDELESAIGLTVPADMRATYRLYNGDNKQGALGWGYLMPLSEIRKTWQVFKEAVDQGLFDDDDARAKPHGPIKQRWWNRKWIPILHNGGGDYHCLDLDPARGGTPGQLIKFQHETGPSYVLAESLGAFLVAFANDLDDGKFRFDPEEGEVKRIAE